MVVGDKVVVQDNIVNILDKLSFTIPDDIEFYIGKMGVVEYIMEHNYMHFYKVVFDNYIAFFLPIECLSSLNEMRIKKLKEILS